MHERVCTCTPSLQVYKESEITNLLSTGYTEKSADGSKRMRLAPLLDAGAKRLPRDVLGFLRRKGAMVPVTTGGALAGREVCSLVGPHLQ